MQADSLSKLDVAFARYIEQQTWQQAIHNRMRAATIAFKGGRTDLFDQYYQKAIELADDHNLKYLELQTRIDRFKYWLIGDLSGERQDKLHGELTYDLLAGIQGSLFVQLKSYSGKALFAYKSVTNNLNQPISTLQNSLSEAQKETSAFALMQLSGYFEEVSDLLKNKKTEDVIVEIKERIQKTVKEAELETEKIRNSLEVDMCLLVAEYNRNLGDHETAEELFGKAEQLCEKLPAKRVTLYLAWTDLYDGLGNIEESIVYANKANEAATQINMAALKEQAVIKLNTLLDRSNADMQEPNVPNYAGAMDRVMSVLDQAHQFLVAGHFEDSLKSCNIALEQATNSQLRRAVLRLRAIVYYELARFIEVETDLNECISLISDELNFDTNIGTGGADSRILEEEDLFLLKAFLMAKMNRSTDSWVIAEQGRSHRLKREMAFSGSFAISQIEDTSFDTIRKWLHSERAAMISFAVTRWGTLALMAGPDEIEPSAYIVEQFTGSKLKILLGQKLEILEGTIAANPIVLESIPGLSKGLIHPLAERLHKITYQASILYIIPDSLLYNAPFAALTLSDLADSQMLIDLCPLAFTSSSAMLRWMASQQTKITSHKCLAVAVGESEGYKFLNQLPKIASVPWEHITEIQGEAATREEVSRLALDFDVLYFICHGRLSKGVNNTMKSSTLELAGKSLLTAQDISAWKLQADLVFLNSCQSGRFRLKARTDVSGFIRGFILAGARSIIAPLIHISPEPAGDFAQAFFQAWLTGANKAEALRKAQINARDSALMDWATYRLFGYFK